ncbi:MAG: flagellar motor protein MotB [Phycisphaerales bacterium]
MPKKPEKKEQGIPEWVVTFGDMMSLLLCFFILLVSFMEMRKEVEYQRVVNAVKEAFGYSGGVGTMPTNDPPTRSMVQLLQELARRQSPTKNVSETTVKSVKGREEKISKIREGMIFTVGGHLTFDPGSAVLKDAAKPELLKVADLLRGRNNKIAVRGHASKKVLPPDSEFADLQDLSYFRAKAVAQFLVLEGRLDEQLLVLDARGATEPMVVRKYDDRETAPNRRVEIVMLEALANQMNPDATFTDEAAARAN